MNTQTYRNHYKTHPERKEKIIFFLVGGFYRTYESDAVLTARFFDFQVQVQGGMKMTGFPVSAAEKYFGLLQQEDYSYVLLQVNETGAHVLDHYQGSKSLQMTVSMETFSDLLEELKTLTQKYESAMRIVKQVDLPDFKKIPDQKEMVNIPLPELPPEKKGDVPLLAPDEPEYHLTN